MEVKKRLLFAVDLTGAGSRIVPEVLVMAHKLDAEIHLLFVSDCLGRYSTFHVPHPSLDSLESEIFDHAEVKLAEFQAEYLGDLAAVTRAVRKGDPAEEILKYAADEGMDLIIVGTHGRKGLDRILFGSVADHVVKHSPVSVLSINPFTTHRLAA